MSAHLVKGDDPILRADALDALVDELLGDDDRTLAVEELTVPGPRRATASPAAPTHAMARRRRGR